MTVVPVESEYVSLSEAARSLSTTEMKILMLLKRKALAGRMVEDGWQVAQVSIDAYESGQAEQNPQPHCSTSCSSARCGCS